MLACVSLCVEGTRENLIPITFRARGSSSDAVAVWRGLTVDSRPIANAGIGRRMSYAYLIELGIASHRRAIRCSGCLSVPRSFPLPPWYVFRLRRGASRSAVRLQIYTASSEDGDGFRFPNRLWPRAFPRLGLWTRTKKQLGRFQVWAMIPWAKPLKDAVQLLLPSYWHLLGLRRWNLCRPSQLRSSSTKLPHRLQSTPTSQSR